MTGGTGATTDDFSPWTSLEIGGTDLGTNPVTHTGAPAGYSSNFDLTELVIAEDAHVYLRDAKNNGNRGGAFGQAEALYVDTLTFADAAGLLNLNGLHLYYKTLNGSPSQIIDLSVPGCLPVVPADFDEDCDVDTDDLMLFKTCAAGPALSYRPGCTLPQDGNGHIAADFDLDDDVDADDFGVYQRCYGGPDVPAEPLCAQ
jgi:hypothetical protein